MNTQKDIQAASEYYLIRNFPRAKDICKIVLDKEPHNIEALNILGGIYYQSRRYNAAIKYFKKIIEVDPHSTKAYNNIGFVLLEKGQLDEAKIYIQKALELNSEYPEAYNHMGMIFQKKGQNDEAISCFQKAITINPNFVYAYNNMGVAYHEKQQPNVALSFFRKALEINQNYSLAHWHLSLALLLSGNFKEGWKEYEWRWQSVGIQSLRPLSGALWDGSDISGKPILLFTEQGIGDAIQFLRYVPLVAKRGAEVFVECHKELVSLVQNVEGVHQVIAYSKHPPEMEIHCPLLSLPLVFGTTLESIPAKIPYITVDPILVQKWREKVQKYNSKIKIGLAWAGKPKHTKDRYRSCLLNTFAPLIHEDIVFFSLQKGKAAEQTKNPPAGMNLVDLTEDIHDFSDTAALIENLNLVISVDTAVAHLAGAMGKPIWSLIPFAPDWRWMLEREDSPWYSSMRLFRQSSLGNWESVIANVKENLFKKLKK